MACLTSCRRADESKEEWVERMMDNGDPNLVAQFFCEFGSPGQAIDDFTSDISFVSDNSGSRKTTSRSYGSFDKHRFFWAVAQAESSGCTNTNHKTIRYADGSSDVATGCHGVMQSHVDQGHTKESLLKDKQWVCNQMGYGTENPYCLGAAWLGVCNIHRPVAYWDFTSCDDGYITPHTHGTNIERYYNSY